MLGNFSEKIKTKTGKIIFSTLLGFGLASLFRKTCKNRHCLDFKAPDNKEIQKTIYKHDKKCYKFSHINKNCNGSNIIEYA